MCGLHFIAASILFFFVRYMKSEEFRCSALDPATDSYHFPNLPLNDQTIAGDDFRNRRIDSSSGVTYIYPVSSTQVNCSGTVTALSYCYTARGQTRTEQLAFTFSTLEQTSSNNFRVTDRIEVYTTPRNEICTTSNGRQFCCDMMPLDMTDYFILPAASNFVFGITIPQTSPSLINVLGLRMPLVPHYQANQLETMITVGQQVLNQGQRLFSLRITNPVSVNPTTMDSRPTTMAPVNPTTMMPTRPTIAGITTPHATARPTTEAPVNPTTMMPTRPTIAGVTTPHATEDPSENPVSNDSTDTEETVSQSTTQSPPGPNASSMMTGVVAAVIVPVVLLLVICGVVVVVIVMTLKRRSKSSSKMVQEQHQSDPMFEKDMKLHTLNGDSADLEEGRYEAIHEYAGIGPEVYSEPQLQPCQYELPVATSLISRDEDIYMAPAMDETRLYAQLNEINTENLPRNHIILGCQLGSGQYGVVHKGILKSPGGEVEVAVKTLKEGSGEEDRVKFLQEAAIMGQFKHHNVVTMHGVVTDGEPILLVLELLMKGDLRNHLLHMKSDEGDRGTMDSHTFLSYCRQVASGMAYLSNKSFVHRDLAARNILVSDDEICKIADFGMSRDLMDENYYVAHGGKIPVKWTAPEAIFYKKYSSASDVWSYGVLMYEIWSVGHKPFKNFTSITDIIKYIDAGFRLPPPPGCPRALYSIMISCWDQTVSKRPDFVNISRKLSISDTKLLQWSEEDRSVHPEAAKLGADLLCGQELYKDLQTRYQKTKESLYVNQTNE